jgi:S1-C subfamily serine protease
MQDHGIAGDQAGSVQIKPAGDKPGRDEPAVSPAAVRSPVSSSPAISPAAVGPAAATQPAAGKQLGAANQRWRRLAACVAAGTLIVGSGFGVYAAAGGLSHAPAAPSTAIPHPPRVNATFVEDDDDVGQDNQENILQATAPGLVQIVSSGGVPVGSGVVITPSGKVLTSDQILPASGPLTARFALAGALFRARVIGTNATTGLALLQLEGGGGHPFPTVTLGNSANFATSAARAQIASWHIGQGTGFTVTALGSSSAVAGATLDVGTLTSLSAAATVGGQRLTGLLQTTAQVVAAQETGGPLVDLSGQVIGIDVAGAGSGLHDIGYAVPINQALSIARHIDRRA